MRVALVAPFPPQQNGIADYASALANSLTSKHVHIDVPLAGLHLSVGDMDGLESTLSGIDWSQYQLVHAEIGGGRLVEFHTMRWLHDHFPNLPKTLTLHDPERVIWQPPTLPQWLKSLPVIFHKIWTVFTDKWTLRQERAFCLAMDAIVVLTRTGKHRLVKKLRLPEHAVHVIPHGCIELPTQPLPALPPAAPLRLLYFGFIYRGKGIEDLIDALAWISKQAPNAISQIQLVLAGGTKPDIAFGHSHAYLDEIKQRLHQRGLSQLAIEWQLDIPAHQIAHTLQSAHMVVLPYIETKKLALLGKMCGTSGVLAWANACGRGVISSDARAFAEEVSYGNGMIVPQQHPVKLGQAILDVLQHPEKIIHTHQGALQQGQQRAWSITSQHFLTLFQQVITRKVAS